MASTRIAKTFSGNGDRQKFTLSLWMKRANSGQAFIFTTGSYGSTSMQQWFFDSDQTLGLYTYNSSGSQLSRLVTNRKFFDTNCWYHIVFRIDTTQSTAADRMRIYVNGVQETSFAHADYISQNENYIYSESITAQYFGQRADQGNTSSFEGIMSHIHMCDGYSYDASSFGETDSTTGEWKINTSPSVSYGTNGYWILKDGNTVTDSSPNSNDFAVTGTLSKTEDNPSNVFNTFNPSVPKHANLTLSNGNTTLSSTNSQWLGSMTSIPLYGGKWYYECKYNTGHNIKLSIVGQKKTYQHFATANQSYGEYNDNGYGYQFNNSGADYLGNNDSTPNWGGGLSSNSGNKIYMVAINLENGKIWYGADGTWFDDASGDTGNPTTDAYPHQTISATHLAQLPFIVTGSVEGNGATMNWNFGNGYFGTTAVSSAGNNASGIGIFEYDVPTGFTAISTKGLNE